jgi:hypothetical protein
VSDEDGRLFVDFHFSPQRLELVPHGEREFSLRWTAADLDFDVRPDGTVAGFTFRIGGDTLKATRVE